MLWHAVNVLQYTSFQSSGASICHPLNCRIQSRGFLWGLASFEPLWLTPVFRVMLVCDIYHPTTCMHALFRSFSLFYHTLRQALALELSALCRGSFACQSSLLPLPPLATQMGRLTLYLFKIMLTINSRIYSSSAIRHLRLHTGSRYFQPYCNSPLN